eukprot:scaffold15730_cov65-Phaeocystis_antarctica.AAC.6
MVHLCPRRRVPACAAIVSGQNDENKRPVWEHRRQLTVAMLQHRFTLVTMQGTNEDHFARVGDALG